MTETFSYGELLWIVVSLLGLIWWPITYLVFDFWREVRRRGINGFIGNASLACWLISLYIALDKSGGLLLGILGAFTPPPIRQQLQVLAGAALLEYVLVQLYSLALGLFIWFRLKPLMFRALDAPPKVAPSRDIHREA